MSRLPPFDPDALSPDQRKIYDAILAGPRGRIAGPIAAWLESPGMAGPAQELGAFLRFNTSLPPRLCELAILVAGRFWSAQYEFWAHARLARKAGLEQDIIDAIAERRTPAFPDADGELVYTLCMQMFETRRISPAAFDSARNRFGVNGVVELMGLIGYYSLVSITLNAFEVPLPEGEKAPLKE